LEKDTDTKKETFLFIVNLCKKYVNTIVENIDSDGCIKNPETHLSYEDSCDEK
jgi:hypothetical protein